MIGASESLYTTRMRWEGHEPLSWTQLNQNVHRPREHWSYWSLITLGAHQLRTTFSSFMWNDLSSMSSLNHTVTAYCSHTPQHAISLEMILSACISIARGNLHDLWTTSERYCCASELRGDDDALNLFLFCFYIHLGVAHSFKFRQYETILPKI